MFFLVFCFSGDSSSQFVCLVNLFLFSFFIAKMFFLCSRWPWIWLQRWLSESLNMRKKYIGKAQTKPLRLHEPPKNYQLEHVWQDHTNKGLQRMKRQPALLPYQRHVMSSGSSFGLGVHLRWNMVECGNDLKCSLLVEKVKNILYCYDLFIHIHTSFKQFPRSYCKHLFVQYNPMPFHIKTLQSLWYEGSESVLLERMLCSQGHPLLRWREHAQQGRVEFETPQCHNAAPILPIHPKQSQTRSTFSFGCACACIKHCCIEYMRRNMNKNHLFKVLRLNQCSCPSDLFVVIVIIKRTFTCCVFVAFCIPRNLLQPQN